MSTPQGCPRGCSWGKPEDSGWEDWGSPFREEKIGESSENPSRTPRNAWKKNFFFQCLQDWEGFNLGNLFFFGGEKNTHLEMMSFGII